MMDLSGDKIFSIIFIIEVIVCTLYSLIAFFGSVIS